MQPIALPFSGICGGFCMIYWVRWRKTLTFAEDFNYLMIVLLKVLIYERRKHW